MSIAQLPGQVRQIGAGFGRPTTVRLSIDVPADLHQAFAAWRSQTALDLGRGVVSVQDTVHALLEVLVSDDAVGGQVRARLHPATDAAPAGSPVTDGSARCRRRRGVV
ncbi:hypothetical protein [Pseudonocardia sp. ICBG601]|uniref:hypothetical protein n=1 Tax=Pseudonocardia sp. ICBG601 TaxID=2846759 RepID=UPI001CF69477|nr:hypothetical protein [Pseudonocardia sp. ICBG601]